MKAKPNTHNFFYTAVDESTVVYALSPDYNRPTLNIPSRDWKGRPVTEVGCLDGNEYVEHIHVPQGIERLGYNAFAQMKALESVDLPDSLRSVRPRAFAEDVALQSLSFGPRMDDVRSAQDCFSYCVSLEKVEFQVAIDCLPDYMFYHCSSLEKVEYPSSVTSFGKSLFEGCAHLREFVINENVRDIGEDVFSGCFRLQTIVCTEDTRGRLEHNRDYYGIPEETDIVSFEQYAELHKPTEVKQVDDGLDM